MVKGSKTTQPAYLYCNPFPFQLNIFPIIKVSDKDASNINNHRKADKLITLLKFYQNNYYG